MRDCTRWRTEDSSSPPKVEVMTVLISRANTPRVRVRARDKVGVGARVGVRVGVGVGVRVGVRVRVGVGVRVRVNAGLES